MGKKMVRIEEKMERKKERKNGGGIKNEGG